MATPVTTRDPEHEYSKSNDKSIDKKVHGSRSLVQKWLFDHTLAGHDSLSHDNRAFLQSWEDDHEPDGAEKNGSRLFVTSNNASSFNMAASNAKITKMAKLLAESEAKNKQITRENSKLQSENKELQAKLRSAVNEKLSMQAMCDQMGNERDKMKSEKSHLSSSLDQLRAYTDGLLANIAKFSKDMEAKLRSAVEEKLGMQAMCDQMGNERDKMKSENNRLQVSCDQLRLDCQSLKAECNEIRDERDSLRNEKNQLASERDKLQTDYRRAVDEKHIIASERDKLIAENKQIRSNVDLLKDYAERTLHRFQDKYLVALQACKAKLKEKQAKIESLERRSATKRRIQDREEPLLASAVIELGLDIVQNGPPDVGVL